MTDVLVKDLYKKEFADGDQVTLSGWIRTIRGSKRVGFIELNDGSFFKNVQVVITSDMDNYADVVKFPISTTIKVVGEVALTPKAQQPFEIHATQVVEEGASDSDYPLQKKAHSY